MEDAKIQERMNLFNEMTKLKYEEDQIYSRRKAVKEGIIEHKVEEFAQVFEEFPPKDGIQLRGLLKQLARDVKGIVESNY